jgi:hypothetical protein
MGVALLLAQHNGEAWFDTCNLLPACDEFVTLRGASCADAAVQVIAGSERKKMRLASLHVGAVFVETALANLWIELGVQHR